MLAITHPQVLPSAMLNALGTPVAIISQLNTLPACAPVNASMAALRLATHDSGSGRFATPFLYDSFIHYSTPVYPGAHHGLLVLLCYNVASLQGGRLGLDLRAGRSDILRESDGSRSIARRSAPLATGGSRA